MLTNGLYTEPFLLERRWQFNLPVTTMKAISIWFALNFLKNNSLLWISRIDLFQIEILSLIGKSELS